MNIGHDIRGKSLVEEIDKKKQFKNKHNYRKVGPRTLLWSGTKSFLLLSVLFHMDRNKISDNLRSLVGVLSIPCEAILYRGSFEQQTA